MTMSYSLIPFLTHNIRYRHMPYIKTASPKFLPPLKESDLMSKSEPAESLIYYEARGGCSASESRTVLQVGHIASKQCVLQIQMSSQPM